MSKWIEMYIVSCPFCGQIHNIVKGSDPPPKCVACMKEIEVLPPKRYELVDVHHATGRGQIAVIEIGGRQPVVGECYAVTRGKQIPGKVTIQGMEYGGAKTCGVLLRGVHVKSGDILVRTVP